MQQAEQQAAEEKAQAARMLAEEQRQAQEKMQQMQQQQLAQIKQLQQMQLMQKVSLHQDVRIVTLDFTLNAFDLQESPAVVYAPGPWQANSGAAAAGAYESEGDQRLVRTLSDFRKQQVGPIHICKTPFRRTGDVVMPFRGLLLG